jgi:general secretion pathway protein L
VNLNELLNTDVEVIGARLGEGVRWWTGELTGMLPPWARRWFETRPSLSAEPLAGGGYRFTRGGRMVMETPTRSRRARPVSLRLPEGAALVREVPTPALPERDLRRMLELDIDRLTPFRPDQVFVDVTLNLPRPGGGQAGAGHALVAAIPRDEAVLAVERAEAAGLDVRALGLASASAAEQAIDFLPRMREARVVAGPGGNRRLIWIVVAGLAIANLGAAIGRDVLDLNALKAQVDAQQPMVDRVLAVRRQVLTEERRRADLLARRASGDPLRMLDTLTAAVPSGAWVDRLAFDGRSARVSGYRQDRVDVAAALRAAPRLTNVRSTGGDLLTRQAAGQPFDLTADLKAGAGG